MRRRGMIEARNRLGLTQAQLSERTGGQVSQSTVSKIEKAATSPTGEHLMLLCEALTITPRELLDVEDDGSAVPPDEVSDSPTQPTEPAGH